MATLFKDMTYTVEGLVREVERGDIALPEIQRPFVWNAAKVRDLFDSMYKGFPVGFLLFWETGPALVCGRSGADRLRRDF